jgi:radical SAM superfamily enzyme YgiQ (UPF0313 family)
MMSTTMTGLLGGETYTSRWFRSLCSQIDALRAAAPDARVVMGGPGGWQLELNDEARRRLRIDHVVIGYCEGNAATLFGEIEQGRCCCPILRGEGVDAECIPRITGPSLLGNVEISRGCGLGCEFCVLGAVPMVHLPVEAVVADVEVNVAAGMPGATLVTEDVLRYGANGPQCDPDALIRLLSDVRSVPGLRLIESDHVNVRSVAQYTDHQLREVRRLFGVDGHQHRYLWLNLGVETASGDLLAANGGRGKMGSIAPSEWGAVCREQVRRLVDAGFFPLVSLVVGLQGETPCEVDETIRWVADLRHDRVAVFPVFYVAVDEGARSFGVQDMTRAHWRLFRLCYGLNFRWIPRLFWDNQGAAGVALWRRMLMQAMGHAQIPWWKALFLWKTRDLLA